MRLSWHNEAWESYVSWQGHDRKTSRKINKLLRDIMRHPYSGLGKPEPLKGNLAGCWSRRINQEDRLVYRIEGDDCVIIQCEGHY